MNPRLDALLRQRELLREHARWLDDEIAAERAGVGSAPPAATHPPAPAPEGTSIAPADETVFPAAGRVELPEPDIKSLHSEVRHGCLLYFVIAAGLVGALIAFIYWKY